MQIDLPQADQKKLALMATEAGYASVELFVAEHLRTLAKYSAAIDSPPLTEKQLQDSLAMCDEGMEEIAKGGGVDAREALLDIGRRRGFSLNE